MNELFKSSLIVILVSKVGLAGVNPTPLLPHKDPADQREFQNVYQNMAKGPSIIIGAGAPLSAPQKIGDIFVSTSTAKIYISTAIATSASWVIIN